MAVTVGGAVFTGIGVKQEDSAFLSSPSYNPTVHKQKKGLDVLLIHLIYKCYTQQSTDKLEDWITYNSLHP